MSIFNIPETFKKRITQQIPAASEKGANVVTELTYVAEYNVLPRDVIKEERAKIGEDGYTLDDYINRICKGVYELKHADGTEIAPVEARDELKKYDITATGLLNGYNEFLNGETKAKNSKK